jgi:hypothetical protein
METLPSLFPVAKSRKPSWLKSFKTMERGTVPPTVKLVALPKEARRTPGYALHTYGKNARRLAIFPSRCSRCQVPP